VDTANGAILGLKKAASANFDASSAGTLQRHLLPEDERDGHANGETGTASLGSATLVVTQEVKSR